MPHRQIPILRATIDPQLRVCFHGIDGKRWQTAKAWLKGKEVEITIRPKRKKRSLNQNSYMWGVVYAIIAEAAGYTVEEMHAALTREFLTIHSDSRLPTVRSTTDLTTAEMEEYLENCRRLGAELYGVYVPLPNEVEMTA